MGVDQRTWKIKELIHQVPRPLKGPTLNREPILHQGPTPHRGLILRVPQLPQEPTLKPRHHMTQALLKPQAVLQNLAKICSTINKPHPLNKWWLLRFKMLWLCKLQYTLVKIQSRCNAPIAKTKFALQLNRKLVLQPGFWAVFYF